MLGRTPSILLRYLYDGRSELYFLNHTSCYDYDCLTRYFLDYEPNLWYAASKVFEPWKYGSHHLLNDSNKGCTPLSKYDCLTLYFFKDYEPNLWYTASSKYGSRHSLNVSDKGCTQLSKYDRSSSTSATSNQINSQQPGNIPLIIG